MTHDPSSRLPELLATAWSGEAAPLREHADGNEAEREATLRRIWDAHRTPDVVVDPVRALARIHDAIDTTAAGQPSTTRSQLPRARRPVSAPVRSPRLVSWLVAACAAVLMAVAGLSARRFFPSSRTEAAPAWQYVTTAGQRRTISLEDGSTMVLAPESRARVVMSNRGRHVELQGQVYLTVAHREHTPFTVSTGDGEIRVLGTRFIVRRYGTDAATRVTVLDGRVGVGRGAAGTAVLGARDAATLVHDSIVVARGIDTADASAWTTGRLVFRDVPLRQVLSELQRWYDVDFVVWDSAHTQVRVTTSVRDATLTDATMQSLALLINARAVRAGRTITFTPNHP